MDYRIAQLEPGTHAGAWLVMAPVWRGRNVEVRARATKTLEAAIRVAERQQYLGADVGAFALHQSPPHGDPMTVEKARQWVRHVADAAAAGKPRAVADLHLIRD